MSTPTSDQATTDETGMPGVRDYELTIPFARVADNNARETTALRVRVPAASPDDACFIGGFIAEHVGRANQPTDGPRWIPLVDNISATDVEDTPAPAELAAQIVHWQKIIAVIAEKYPTMVQVTAAEYAAADPARLATVTMGDDTVMYAATTSLTTIAEGSGLGTILLPAPDGIELPGAPDPDVRGVKVQSLPIMPGPGLADLLHQGQWMPIMDVEVGVDLSVTVTLMPADVDGYTQWRFNDLEEVVAVRPAAVPSEGSDLPSASMHGRQLLARDGWWTVAAAEFGGPMSQAYRTTLVKNPNRRNDEGAVVVTGGEDIRHTSIAAGDQVLLRDEPPKWWS